MKCHSASTEGSFYSSLRLHNSRDPGCVGAEQSWAGEEEGGGADRDRALFSLFVYGHFLEGKGCIRSISGTGPSTLLSARSQPLNCTVLYHKSWKMTFSFIRIHSNHKNKPSPFKAVSAIQILRYKFPRIAFFPFPLTNNTMCDISGFHLNITRKHCLSKESSLASLTHFFHL